MFDYDQLFLVACVYLFTLFLIAYAADRGLVPQRLIRHPAVYALSLGVYTTSWSYYGSVGFAQDQGLLFLTVYLGPTLAFLLAPVLLAPILRLTEDYQLTSVADLFAFRYSSQLAGVLVTVFMLAGTLPYIALQISAVTESFAVLTESSTPLREGLLFCLVLIAFAMLFGARHVSPREKHGGLVLAIAFESLVKLTALLAVGTFALFGVFGGPGGLEDWLVANPQALVALYQPVREGPWLTLILLSFAAAFLLPRQFYMIFVENLGRRSLRASSWAFPLYLLLFNLPILPILWAGQVLAPGASAEYHTLGITLASGGPLLPTLAFIGGISAASAMVIVTTLALSQMALNHLLLPASYPDPSLDMYRWLIWGRRMLITGIILVSFGLYALLERRPGLVELGLISFVAVAQCLPGLIGVLLWPRATRTGFLWGLGGGMLVWYLLLVTPLLADAGLTGAGFDAARLLGVADQNLWHYATLWTLGVNGLLFVLASLLTRPDGSERRAIAACFQHGPSLGESRKLSATSPTQFSDLLDDILGAPNGQREVERALADLQLEPEEHRPHQLQRLRDRIERNLSGMLGPMLARLIIDSRLPVSPSTRSMLAAHIRHVEERLELSRDRLRGLAGELDALRRYHRQVLQDLPLGVCALSQEQEILNWNQAMVQLSGIDRPVAIGAQLRELPAPWSALLRDFLVQDEQHLHKVRVFIQGRARWFSLHKAAIAPTARPREREPFWSGVVLLVEDMTEIQTLEMELAHSERLASIGRLAAGVAHEIGNPVTGIASLTQNLRDETDPEIVRESLEDILEQTRRINAIVQTLLTFSHGGGPAPQDYSRFRLRDCIEDACRLVRLSHAAKQLDYHNHCAPDLQVEADRQRLAQVFVNLRSNASDASRPGDRVEVAAHAERGRVRITVSDAGDGIPEDFQARIFEPFFTTKEPGQGTGLGLPLVYNIVQDHGGSITVESTPGCGTRFVIQLPARQPAPEALTTE
ncbi:MAG: ATP-binding protein [Candidatus Competibacterales bacterium]|nr:ATP-binding protein [Candidatus Competibacterales bacterium]